MMWQAREISGDQRELCDSIAIDWLAVLKIRVKLFSVRLPAHAGTIITTESEVKKTVRTSEHDFSSSTQLIEQSANKSSLRAIGIHRNVKLWSLNAAEMCHTAGFLARVFAIFEKSDDDSLQKDNLITF